MAQSAALLVDEVLPEQPMCQWVSSFPFPLRFRFASRPQNLGRALEAASINDLRMALTQNRPIGNTRFYVQIEAMTDQRGELRKRGRP